MEQNEHRTYYIGDGQINYRLKEYNRILKRVVELYGKIDIIDLGGKTLGQRFNALNKPYTLCSKTVNDINELLNERVPYSNRASDFPVEQFTELLQQLDDFKNKLWIWLEPVAKAIEDKNRLAEQRRIAREIKYWESEERRIATEKERADKKRIAVRKKKEQAKKKEERERQKKLQWIAKHLPSWTTVFNGVESLISRSDIANMSIEELQAIKLVCDEKFALLSSIKDEVYSCSDYEYDIVISFNKLYDELNRFNASIYSSISIKSKTKRQINKEKLRSNTHEDKPLFCKMKKLLDDKSAGMWYENESRKVLVKPNESIQEYMHAYGRIIRGGLRSAEIISIGQEDTDEWGYIVLSDKYLPYCIREVKMIEDNLLYHIFTFSTQLNMEEYDFDEAITERVIKLNSIGIKY